MIYFLRHGETYANSSETITGISDVSLTEKGLKQAYDAKKLFENIHIDVCFCSPLKRTVDTCNIVCEGKNVEIFLDDRIIARNYGVYEGVKYSKAHGKMNWNINVKEDKNICEPVQDMVARIFNFLDFLKENYKDKDVLIVSHSSVGKIINCYFNGFPHNGDVFTKIIRNAEIVKYSFK